MNTENELFGELHEQEEHGLFGNEHRRQYEGSKLATAEMWCKDWEKINPDTIPLLVQFMNENNL